MADRSQSALDDLAEVDANAIAVGLGIGKEGMPLPGQRAPGRRMTIGAMLIYWMLSHPRSRNRDKGSRSNGQVSGTTKPPGAADVPAAGQEKTPGGDRGYGGPSKIREAESRVFRIRRISRTCLTWRR